MTMWNGSLESLIFSSCHCTLFWRLTVARLEGTRLSICTSVVFCKALSEPARSCSLEISPSPGMQLTLCFRNKKQNPEYLGLLVVWPQNKAIHVCLSDFQVLHWSVFSVLLSVLVFFSYKLFGTTAVFARSLYSLQPQARVNTQYYKRTN